MALKSVIASSSEPGRRSSTACNLPISEETPQSPHADAMSSVIATVRGDHSSPPYAADRIDTLMMREAAAASIGCRGLFPKRRGHGFRSDRNGENATPGHVTDRVC